MRFSPTYLSRYEHDLRFVKSPAIDAPPAQQDPAVVETVTQMLERIERDGLDAVRDYAERLDGWSRPDFIIGATELAESGDGLPDDLRAAIETGSRRTRAFARAHRTKLTDFEFEPEPGIRTGVTYVPVGRVGAYLPAGAGRAGTRPAGAGRAGTRPAAGAV